MIAISRRVVLSSLVSVPFAAVFTAGTHTSAEVWLEDVSVETPSGTVRAVLAVPSTVPAPAVLLIHGSAGLIDFYRSWTIQLAREGFVGLAVDQVWLDRIVACVNWLKSDPRTTGKVGIIGWSSGADMALITSTIASVDATVVYVSVLTGIDLSGLKGPVLGHFGERDTSTPKSKVETFEGQMKDAGKSLEVHWYPGDHYFPFPNRPSYDKELADAASGRTVEFFRKNLH